MSNLRFEDLPKAMELVLDKLLQIEEELKNIKECYQPNEPTELMTRQEVVEYFKISFPTLHQWTKHGILVSYRMGNRVYYKRSEILDILNK
ncbi:Helix-turn-helix domain-containing protein [Maribacter aquivivus]|uniref:Helix-turn-helix domain-containing protein n=1 Tax=Maribacter aquivivus TaxID=228958 RepID=A0A1M6L673_9FLAO|nr:helix-turn-helix domain-containing protein [Maribacter aquivivus]SHJ66549.1 Helix-turn-helix domain-containing protein [Maribacter aquivivus]